MRAPGLAMAVLVAALAGCSGDDGDVGSAMPTDEVSEVELAGTIELDVDNLDRCDPIGGEHCLLPFPNDHFTDTDDDAPTGRRVAFVPASMPANADGVGIDPTHWNDLDGFSPAAAALVQIPDVDLDASGAAPVTDPARSLDDDSPVVLFDATTGDRLAHWVELDEAAEPDATPTLFVRPAAVLPEGHRIVVALRGLVDGAGAAIEPTDAFRAYRDRLDSGIAAFEERRPAMEAVFADLDEADVDRDDLIVAWDFTVASAESLSSRLLHLRDDAFERIEDEPTRFTVDTDEPSDREGIARQVSGTFDVPLYLTDGGGPGSELVLGADGLPEHTGTFTAAYSCIVPDGASAETPAASGLYGHGLLGSHRQVTAPFRVAAEGNRVFCGTDLIGMSEGDIANAATIVGELSSFNTLADRLQQGHLNTLVLGRLMVSEEGFGSDPAFQDAGTPLLTDELVYYGISQGGIMGAATTAVAQDWTLAVLDVTGINYGLLLDRSIDFDPFRSILEPAYPAAADRALGLQLIQMLWDRGEATGYLQHLTTDPYPDTPEHRVLLHVAFGDHQVTPLAAAVEARSIGAAAVRPVLAEGRSPEADPFWDVPRIDTYPHEGSAIVMWDSGAVTPPMGNRPPREGVDPHSDPRQEPTAIEQIVAFLASGQVIDVCGDDPCTARPRE